MRTQSISSLSGSISVISSRQLYSRLLLALRRANWSALLTGAGLFGLFVALLALVQFATPNLAGNDGYYHIKLAQVMRQQGLRPAFPWLPMTILNPEAYVDHHFLFHVLLTPFTLGDLRLGAKWASVILPAATFLVGWILLRGQRVPYAPIWALGFLAVSEAFLYRMSMPRTQAPSLLVLLLALHLLFTRRYRWLLPLSFLYVWLYDAFPLVIALVGVYVASRLLLDRVLDLKPLIFSGVGIGLGLLINPYFPDNLIFVYNHLLPKLTDPTAISVGNEWKPYQTWTLVENSGLALAAFIGGAFALGFNRQRMSTRTATTFFLAIFFGLMLFKSRRFVEYFPAFALIFAAFAWAPLIRRWLAGPAWRLKLDLSLNEKRIRLPFLELKRPERVRILALVLVIAWLPLLSSTIQDAQQSIQRTKPYEQYGAASAWLEANTPAGSRVFQTDWDDFPLLYFHNTHNTYLVGLDPTYLQLYDADLYDLWVDITRGRVEAPAQTIADTFGSSHVLTDLRHKSFLRQAESDPGLVEVYRDEYAAIFEVVIR
ncbi:MAG: hypothetical protein ACE5H9_08490 [Anaerolineae bacterium]